MGLTIGTARDATKRRYFVLKESSFIHVRDPDDKAGERVIGVMRQRYVAYLGQTKTITRKKAQKICKDKDIAMSELECVNGLEIYDEAEKTPSV